MRSIILHIVLSYFTDLKLKLTPKVNLTGLELVVSAKCVSTPCSLLTSANTLEGVVGGFRLVLGLNSLIPEVRPRLQ